MAFVALTPGQTLRDFRAFMSPIGNSVLDASAQTLFICGHGAAMTALNAIVADVAPTNIAVLLIGESGTGKETYARHVHRLSKTHAAPLKKVSCATLDSARLLDQVQDCWRSTSAEPAAGGLFLDGVEDLDLACQRALASVLPDGGSEIAHAKSVRLLCSTSINLQKAIDTGRFRNELFFRINGVSLRLPPLRERKEDIPALVAHFMTKHATELRERHAVDGETMELLVAHSWPGNIRELENIVKKMMAFANPRLALSDLRAAPQLAQRGDDTVAPEISSLKVAARAASRRTERELILKALERTHWNRKRAAQELQISYKSLLYKIKQIAVPGAGPEEL
jgi:two-component system response regulator AtoC